MNEMDILKYTIDHWELILDLHDDKTPLWELKIKALQNMSIDNELIHSVYEENACFLCFFHYSMHKGEDCCYCPMLNQWPAYNSKETKLKHCMNSNSVYNIMDDAFLSPKKKYIKILINAFKERLKELSRMNPKDILENERDNIKRIRT